MDNVLDGMSESEKENLFYDLFYRALDSWNSTDFFACDQCIDEFLEKYSGLYLLDEDFQCSGMPLELFHSGSRISDIFDENEFQKYLHLIECSYCSRPLEHNFWPYYLPFDTEAHKSDIEDVSKIATSTPFLLLSNDFATKIFELIKEMANILSNELIETNVYRGRIAKTSDTLFDHKDLGPVPDALAKEGRFNHSGHGHLYVATSKEICVKEIRGTQNDDIFIAQFKLLKPLKILDLTDIEGRIIENELYSVLISSALIYNYPGDSWDKPEYVFTRFVADCAIFAGFDGIKYISRFNSEGANYVIFKNKSKDKSILDSIYTIENVVKIN